MKSKSQGVRTSSPKGAFCALIQRERTETALLMRNIPATVTSLFVVSVVCMNLLANKTLYQNEFFAIDGGFLVSWLSFMCMDIITKYFGPRASTRIAVLASAVNLLCCLIFYIASLIPSNAADYSELDRILGGTWFILLGSTLAFLISAVINNFLNYTVSQAFKKNPDGKLAFAASAYISTFIGQFIDNLIFSVVVFIIFAPIFWDGFCWTPIQCVTCALTGAAAELVMEILFSPVGYRIVKRWREMGVGREYLECTADGVGRSPGGGKKQKESEK